MSELSVKLQFAQFVSPICNKILHWEEVRSILFASKHLFWKIYFRDKAQEYSKEVWGVTVAKFQEIFEYYFIYIQ